MRISKVIGSFLLVSCSVWGAVVSDPLLKLLDVMNVPHDGTLSSIVAETQKYWIRPAGKERWEIEGELENKTEVMELASELGFIHEIYPLKQEYDYCLLFGATVARMEKRLNYAVKLWNKGVRFKKIVFLTGARPLDPAADQLTDICKTEAEAADYIWKHADLPEEFSELPVTFVEAQMLSTLSGFKRPTTADTINAWVCLEPTPGTCLGISNQPFCLYQEVVADSCLPKAFEFEVVGEGVSPDRLSGPVLLDTIARWINNLPPHVE